MEAAEADHPEMGPGEAGHAAEVVANSIGCHRYLLNVFGLITMWWWCGAAHEAHYYAEDEDKDNGEDELPLPIARRSLTFVEEEEDMAWRDLESQAKAILPRTVYHRALTLLRCLMDGNYVSWRPGTLELVVDGTEQRGIDLLDLASHVVHQRPTKPLLCGSPSLPPGFGKFTIALRYTNASREMVKNRRCWPFIYSIAAPLSGDDDDEIGEGMQEEEDKKIRLEEEQREDEEGE